MALLPFIIEEPECSAMMYQTQTAGSSYLTIDYYVKDGGTEEVRSFCSPYLDPLRPLAFMFGLSYNKS